MERSAVRIRRGTAEDLPEITSIFAISCGRLIEQYFPTEHADLPLDPDDRIALFTHLLKTGAFFVAGDPAPVGFSAAIVRDDCWLLSQFWVLPDHQGRGVGAALLDAAIEWGKEPRVRQVVASPHPGARTLYLRAGLLPYWEQFELEGPGGGDLPPGFGPLTDEDQGWIDDLDRSVRGWAGPEDHAWFREIAQGVALRRDGAAVGYVYGPGKLATGPARVGPGAVRDPKDLPDLLRAARSLSQGPVSFAVPSLNHVALRTLVDDGFRYGESNTYCASEQMGDPSRRLSAGGALA